MNTPPHDLWNDAWIEQLVDFDEALRLGRHTPPDRPFDAGLAQTQQFLVRLQSLWPRAAKRIGPYLLVRSLGPGAIGPSYLVEDPVTAQPLVLKILWPDLCAHAQTRQQFVQNARAAQQVRHASIATV